MVDFKSIVEHLNEMFFALDESLTITYWNKACEYFTGLKPEEVKGKPFHKFFPSSKNPPDGFYNVLSTKKPEIIITEYNYSGEKLLFELNVFSTANGIGVLAKDVTLRIQEQANRKQAEENYKRILDILNVGCVVLDFNWNCIYINEVFAGYGGYKVSDVLGKNVLDVIPRFERNPFYKSHLKTMQERVPTQFTSKLIVRTGEKRWYESYAVPVPEGILIRAFDITEHKRTEERLRNSERRFKSTLDNMVEGCTIIDFNWKFLYVNDVTANHSHNIKEKMVGCPVSEAIPGFEGSLFHERYKITMNKRLPQHFEADFTFSDGTTRWFEIISVPVPEGIFVQSLDITDRKGREEDLGISEARFHKAFLVNPNALVICTVDEGIILELNDSFANLIGWNRDEIIGKRSGLLNMFVDSSTRSRAAAILLTQKKLRDYEVQIRRKSGEIRIALLSAEVLDTSEGPRFLTIFKDITEEKAAEKKIHELLRLSEKRTAELNAVIESIPDAIFIGNINGIEKSNSRGFQLFGASSIEDLRSIIGDLAEKSNIRLLKTGTPLRGNELPFIRALHGETVEEELIALNFQTGKDIYIRIAAAPVKYNNEVMAAVAVQSDITEKIKNEHMLKASLREKEVLLQELYHRTKNNMQVISSLLGLKASAINNPELTSVVEEMQDRIHAIALVHEKLYQSSNLSRVNLRSYIEDLAGLLSNSYSEKLKNIFFKFELEDINVLIDTAIPCGLIISELFSNSIKYAFPGNVPGIIKVVLERAGNEILLEISDNGKGINENDFSGDSKLGIQLVKMIAENQLQAETQMKNENGVSWTIKFKDTLYFERV